MTTLPCLILPFHLQPLWASPCTECMFSGHWSHFKEFIHLPVLSSPVRLKVLWKQKLCFTYIRILTCSLWHKVNKKCLLSEWINEWMIVAFQKSYPHSSLPHSFASRLRLIPSITSWFVARTLCYLYLYLHKHLTFEQHTVNISVKLSALLLACQHENYYVHHKVFCGSSYIYILLNISQVHGLVPWSITHSVYWSPFRRPGFQVPPQSPGTSSSAHSDYLLFLENAARPPRLLPLITLFPLTACPRSYFSI